MVASILLLIGILFCSARGTRGANLTDVDTIYVAMTNSTAYAQVIPLMEQAEVLSVSVDFQLQSINSFDEVSGQLSVTGVLRMQWREERLSSIYSSYLYSSNVGDITDLTGLSFPYGSVWHPELILANAVESEGFVGNAAFRVQVKFEERLAEWNPRVSVVSSCTPDVTYYPFDVQECSFGYIDWNYDSDTVKLSPLRSDIDTSIFEENGEWSLERTTADAREMLGGRQGVSFGIEIKRRSLYYVINIVLPTLLLGLLNGFVFLLPAASGERVGFSITCFLSYVVLGNTIMSLLPRASSPMSLLSFYVMMMTVFSALMSLITILTLRVYHKHEKEKVPRWLTKFADFVTCKTLLLWCRKRSRDNSTRGSIRETSAGGLPTECSDIQSAKASTVPAETKDKSISGLNSRKFQIQPLPVTEGRPKLATRFKRASHSSFSGSVLAETIEEEQIASPSKRTSKSSFSVSVETTEEEDPSITWETLGGLIDGIAFCGFLAVQILFSVSYLLPLGIHTA